MVIKSAWKHWKADATYDPEKAVPLEEVWKKWNDK
jgi:hypothetical protein